MTNISTAISDLPPQQQAIRDKCFHPTGRFVEFKKEEIEQSIPDLFEQIVRAYPDRLAVKTKTHELTYDELNKAANRVARAILAHRGEGQEPIALLFEHGAPLIAAILGVLKAGKIYVPLDPSHPRARIDYTLDDSQTRLIVTNNLNLSLANALAHDKCQLMNVNAGGANLSPDNPGLPFSPDTLAYLLYTSGSTGQPKGIIQTHRNVLHKIMIYSNDLHICTDDRLTLLYSCSSSASVRDIFSALLKGAALFPFDLHVEGLPNLAAWLRRDAITICHAPASVFRHFACTLSREDTFPALRVLYVANEPVCKRDVELYKAYFSPDCLFVNALVSSEALTVRQHFIDKGTLITGSNVSVGYAVEGNEVMLLDEAGKDVGFNQIGEITVKSRYLSPGYWRRPELTQAAFLPDPEGGQERIYRTGDLGRLLPDSCLQHVGRKDFQVKIRGNRVEVAEIELALLSLDIVKGAVVMAREGQLGDNRLVAYLAPAKHPGPTVDDLRSFLREKFPDYMIPSAFVMLEAMPLTPNGKVDRKALPVPDSSRPELDTPYVAPRTPVEKVVAQMWAEVLGLDQVGINDPFLDLGGDSLAASRVVSRGIDRFKLKLPVTLLFESGTVAEMAKVIVQNQARSGREKERARISAELESSSYEEARKHLADEGAKEDLEK